MTNAQGDNDTEEPKDPWTVINERLEINEREGMTGFCGQPAQRRSRLDARASCCKQGPRAHSGGCSYLFLGPRRWIRARGKGAGAVVDETFSHSPTPPQSAYLPSTRTTPLNVQLLFTEIVEVEVETRDEDGR